MPRRVFFSFDYDADRFRVSQVRQMGVLEGERVAHDNDWESVKGAGDDAIKKWIMDQMDGTSCTVVLIGQYTGASRWVPFEAAESWNRGKGVVGVYINRLRCMKTGAQCIAGSNPLDSVTMKESGKRMSDIVRTYAPPSWDSTQAYAYIKAGLPAWIEEAILIRQKHP